MNALEELPEKDKNLMLPFFRLRGWVGSQKLTNTVSRIQKSIGKRYWIADIDGSFLEHPDFIRTGEYPREVFKEIKALLDSNNGYENWFQYLRDIPEAIPTLQLSDYQEVGLELDKLLSLQRGLVVKFSLKEIESQLCYQVIELLAKYKIETLIILFDYGRIDSSIMAFVQKISDLIRYTATELPNATISISSSSFPDEFAGYENGEKPIYERLLFNKIKQNLYDVKLIYSDRGGARAEKIKGGGGVPAPRIDYPLNHDWRFIRLNYDDPNNIQNGEKSELYKTIARRMVDSNYWEPNLYLWGTQLIVRTEKGDKYGIDSPAKATAVRINIHLHRQLHYGADLEIIDTDDDWID